jgi:type IV pilus assembly protein PilE
MQKGFSLLEVMIVCALIAILASFAYGGWRFTIEKSHRVDAQQSLYRLAVALEDCYQQRRDYVSCAELIELSEITPLTSGQGYFLIFLKEVTVSEYVIIARGIADSNVSYELSKDGNLQLNL